jgi:hypothetical protein
LLALALAGGIKALIEPFGVVFALFAIPLAGFLIWSLKNGETKDRAA